MIVNFAKLLYFTFLHNYQVLGFSVMTAVSLVFLIKKPSRTMVFFFVGFLLLILHFEYQKHIVDNLAEQTADVLFTTGSYYRTQWLVKVGFYHLLPLLLYLSGWTLVTLGMIRVGKTIQMDKPSK